MIFGKSRRYRLPNFPDNVIPIFWSLAKALPPEEIPDLRQQLKRALVSLRTRARNNLNMDMGLAGRLEEVAFYLLDRYEEFNEEQRALIVGAAKYFLAEDDPLSEAAFATGFDDDAQVMNFVLEELGIEDRFVELG